VKVLYISDFILILLFIFFKCYREETKEVCRESCMDCIFWKKVLKPKMRDLYILLNIYLNINSYLFWVRLEKNCSYKLYCIYLYIMKYFDFGIEIVYILFCM
jgi:hypothetical protein